MVVVGMPVAYFLPPRKKPEPAVKDTEAGASTADGDAVEVADSEVAVAEIDDTEIAETVDFDSSQLSAMDEEPATDEFADSDLFLDDEEEPPQKPKKKR